MYVLASVCTKKAMHNNLYYSIMVKCLIDLTRVKWLLFYHLSVGPDSPSVVKMRKRGGSLTHRTEDTIAIPSLPPRNRSSPDFTELPSMQPADEEGAPVEGASGDSTVEKVLLLVCLQLYVFRNLN